MLDMKSEYVDYSSMPVLESIDVHRPVSLKLIMSDALRSLSSPMGLAQITNCVKWYRLSIFTFTSKTSPREGKMRDGLIHNCRATSELTRLGGLRP
jgi:hypothetical protein